MQDWGDKYSSDEDMWATEDEDYEGNESDSSSQEEYYRSRSVSDSFTLQYPKSVNHIKGFREYWTRRYKIRWRNGNENVRKKKQAKQPLCICVAPFCTFLCRFCTILTWNRLTRFIEDVTSDDEILFLFLNLDIVLRNLTSGGFAYIWQSKWVEIIVIKTERTQIHFLSDVFATIASYEWEV